MIKLRGHSDAVLSTSAQSLLARMASLAIAALVLHGLVLSNSYAQSASQDSIPARADTETGAVLSERNSRGIGGPSSVTGQLNSDADSREGRKIMLPDARSRKERWQEDYGLEIGADYNVLGLYATESNGEDTAIGGALRIYGHWQPFAKRSPNYGALVFKAEHRHKLGTDVPPQSLGNEVGFAGIPATVFSDAGAILTNLYWSQQLAANRFAFVAGVVDVTDYVDVYGLVNPWTEFNNLAFSTSPTIPSPNQGLGAAARFSITPQYYVLAGVADANGDPEEPEDFLDSFFDDREYFKHIEIGWVESFDKRYTDNIHLLFWEADERTDADVEDGWGITFSFSRLLANRWMPFVRAGYADDGGALLKRAVSLGTGYIIGGKLDFVGFGAEWGRPADSFGEEASDEDQYTFELYLRWQPLAAVQIVPSVQYVVNPALNQAQSDLWIPGLRVRAVF